MAWHPEVVAWVQLIIVVGLGIKAVGGFWQKREDVGTQNARDIVDLSNRIERELREQERLRDKELVAIDKRLDEAGREMSKWGSYLQGIEARFDQRYVTKELCDVLVSRKAHVHFRATDEAEP
jgi:hypothetical protein